MSYPDSPFPESFNYSLINTLLIEKCETTISNDCLEKTLKWLCSFPKITSIRVNTLKTNSKDVLERIQNYFKYELQKLPNIYIHPILLNTIIIENKDVQNKAFIKYEKEVIVDINCGAAVLRGAHIYAPGVLGMVSGCQYDDNVSIYVDRSKKCKKGLQKVYNEESKVYIGNGTVKMQRHQLFSDNRCSGIAIEVTDPISGCFPINDSVLPTGYGLLQNIPSILCVQALNPQPNDVILDMCASPGNKTTHIAELMQNIGILIAIDKTPKKVAQLKSRCEDFGSNVHIFQADSTSIIKNTLDCGEITAGPPFVPNSFDKILLDAPCSVLGKRPQIANMMSQNEIKSYVPLQRKLFETAVYLLKPGGKLVYSTCTITLSENEGVVAWALKKFDNLELVKPTVALSGPGWKGTSLTQEEMKKVQRFGPDDDVDSVGFFFACFMKQC